MSIIGDLLNLKARIQSFEIKCLKPAKPTKYNISLVRIFKKDPHLKTTSVL